MPPRTHGSACDDTSQCSHHVLRYVWEWCAASSQQPAANSQQPAASSQRSAQLQSQLRIQ
jgi:hypothetical protein